MDECEHGSDPATCRPCNPVRTVRSGRPTVARFAASCTLCREWWEPGDMIEWCDSSPRGAGWAHAVGGCG